MIQVAIPIVRALDRRIVAASRRLGTFAVALAVALASFAAIMGIAAGFSRATHGLVPFDLQNDLTRAWPVASVSPPMSYLLAALALLTAAAVAAMLFKRSGSRGGTPAAAGGTSSVSSFATGFRSASCA